MYINLCLNDKNNLTNIKDFIRNKFMSVIEKEIEFECLKDDSTDPLLVKLGYPALPIEYEIDLDYSNQTPIGKRLHFIWVGRVIPDKYKLTVIQSKRINPDYEVILWVDFTSITNSIRIELEQQNIIVKNIYQDELNRDQNDLKEEMLHLLRKNSNGGYQADIIRLYVVYMYGGIYSDIDSVWLKPLDENFTYEFLTYRIDKHCSNFTNSFFGFAKGSYILKNLLKNLKYTIGFFERLNNLPMFLKYIPGITGPSYVTWIIKIMKPKHLNYIHQAYCVIGGPHEELHSSFSKEGKSYCYQTFDRNWCL